MAAITTTAVAVAATGYSIYQGEQQRKEAEEAMRNIETPELDNRFEDMPISTVGSDILREESSRIAAMGIDAARNAGSRGIFSTIPKIQANSNRVNQETRRYLDDQVQKRNYAIASDNARIEGIEERRYAGALAGAGQLMEAGQERINQGITDLFNTGMYAARNISGDSQPEAQRPVAESVGGNLTPMGPIQFGSPVASATSLGGNSAYEDYLRMEENRRLYNEASPKYGLD